MPKKYEKSISIAKLSDAPNMRYSQGGTPKTMKNATKKNELSTHTKINIPSVIPKSRGNITEKYIIVLMDLNANSRNPKIRSRPLASPETHQRVNRTQGIFKNIMHPKNYEKIFIQYKNEMY